MLHAVNQSQGVRMFSVGYILVLQSQLHNDGAWRQRDFKWYVSECFAIHYVKTRIVSVVFVVEVCITNTAIQGVTEMFYWG